MNQILDILKTGKVPEVPFKVTIDNDSILKIAVAAIVAATIIILIAHLVKRS
jgi:hypothetical protein